MTYLQGILLPDNYFVFDFETTGFAKTDIPIDVGYCQVVNRKVASSGKYMLNWPDYPGADLGWLAERIRHTAYEMHKAGNQYPYSVEMLRQQGEDPAKVIWWLLEQVRAALSRKEPLAGHSFLRTELPILRRASEELFDQNWSCAPEQVMDSLVLVKSAVLQRPRGDHEPHGKFYARMQGAKGSGQSFALTACADRFNLYERGLGRLHCPLQDSLATHYLLEVLREQYGEEIGAK